jgi:hypothetical protein
MGLGKSPNPLPDMEIPAVSYCYRGPIAILVAGATRWKSAQEKCAASYSRMWWGSRDAKKMQITTIVIYANKEAVLNEFRI